MTKHPAPGTRIQFPVFNGEHDERWTGTVVDAETRSWLIEEDSDTYGNPTYYYDDWLFVQLVGLGFYALHVDDKYQVIS